MPEKIVSSEDLEQKLGLEKGWIEKRTGIKSRRWADDLVQLYVNASLDAVKNAGVQGIDTIVVCWDAPDNRHLPIPSEVHSALKPTAAMAPNVEYVEGFPYCSGFLSALNYARLKIENGESQGVLVAAASKLSEYCHPKQKESSVLWGDGAGALVLAPSTKQEILGRHYQSEKDECFEWERYEDGKKAIRMDGSKVYRFVTTQVPKNIEELLAKTGYDAQDVSLFIFHQANERMLRKIQEILNLRDDQVFSNVAEYGNTGVASIPIAYHQSKERLKSGDLYVMCGFGRGLTINSTLLQKP